MKLYLIKLLKLKSKFFLRKKVSLFSLALVSLFPSLALAEISESNLKAVSQLQGLQQVISGPILTSIAVIMVVVTSVMLSMGEWGDGFKRLIQIVFWISIAAGASSMVATFMS